MKTKMKTKSEEKMKECREFVDYTIPKDAVTLGLMSFVVYREEGGKGTGRVVAPWKVNLGISPDDRVKLARLGKAICKAVDAFGKKEMVRKGRKRTTKKGVAK